MKIHKRKILYGQMKVYNGENRFDLYFGKLFITYYKLHASVFHHNKLYLSCIIPRITT